MKRLFDLGVALFTFIASFPLMVFIGIGIKVKLGSPVIFKQERPGLHGTPFCVYKFRTMKDSRDMSGRLLPDHLRLTRFGKFLRKYSLDELPQLINVIKGDISLVGPRPLLMEYLSLYTEEQAKRHKVRPGITGWAQVNGRNSISWEEKFELDNWYVDNQTFLLDLKILFLTAIKVLKTEGITQSGCATMEKFKGSRSSLNEGQS